MNKKLYIFFIILFSNVTFGIAKSVNTEGISSYIQSEISVGSFKIVEKNKAATIYIDPEDWAGVLRGVKDLGLDIHKVTGVQPSISYELNNPQKGAIIIGTIGKSRLIDQLIDEGKINVLDIKGQWESFLIQTVGENLVVAGSDKRGTIFGIYDISEKIGVSPWYWWADVPVKKNESLYVKAGRYIQSSPKVKYRGIFINDEEPSFGGWAREKFGGINSEMYKHVFELILRLKANYLWPAMWGKSFNEDDPLNPIVADEYGIIMGTSHHEPMMRAHKEYTVRRDDVGPWDYSVNKESLDKFFFEGINRNKAFENLITIGMRGDGDVAMGDGSDIENIKTLEKVIKGQREIISKVYKKPPSETPQMWAIFTEVQRYYDAGFSVPDDVMLIFCDNNWGYIRRIGPSNEKSRKGGMGLYYHIDMNGGPWNDRWINTTTIPKLREQLNLAYQTGLDALWVVNVGDLKPKEFPIDFILRYAWNPDAIPANKVWEYTLSWSKNIFGEKFAEEIAYLVSKYSKYNLYRKPEVQDTQIFSYVNHHEADSVLKNWKNLVKRVEILRPKIPSNLQDAFFQLVYYPVKASAGVAEIYLAAGWNNLYAKQGRVSANDYAKRARELLELDKELSDYYNMTMTDGKWKNMMSDIHIGYTQWYMPEASRLPPLVEITPLNQPNMGIAVEGCENAWPGSEISAELPTFDIINNPSYYIDVFNRGIGAFEFHAKSNMPWIKLSSNKGRVTKDYRIQVEIDWNHVMVGKSSGVIEVKKGEKIISIQVNVVKTSIPESDKSYYGGLVGEFSIPAYQFHSNKSGRFAEWILLPDLGRGEACMGIHPVTAPSSTTEDAPILEYNVFLPDVGETTICLGILPTQDVYPERGLRIGVALDSDTPTILDARKGLVDTFKEYTPENLLKSTVLKPLPPVRKDLALVGLGKHRRNEIFDNLRWIDVTLDVKKAGFHSLKIYMIDPEIVLETIVINPDNKYPSYFGAPPKRFNANINNK